MAKKYYVVWSGRQNGIYTTWEQCKQQVDGFAGAKFKAFPSLAEAEAAFGRKTDAVTRHSPTKTQPKKAKPAALTQSQIEAMPFDIKIFSDGGCEPNPGKAGTGLAVYEHNKLSELWFGLYQQFGTNNTAELRGLHHALLMAKDKITHGHSVAIFCDSKYSIDCITQWAPGWEKKGWKKSGGEIKNLDIIQSAYRLYQELATHITLHHVNGHVDIEGNELADRMSIVAIDTQETELAPYRKPYNIAEIMALRTG
ncbi:ribonuclease H family protein [Vibrio palustris]|uniref:Ribonuclease H n=1 Tax=Vibrio palustris TaxID=1918946 RepID=A0A1R4B5R3_9VIBR|nr:ribonuclease H family protein [Vibrio palustris]SJL84260.1 Ribonuclease H [Vibrio palustris]